MADKVDKSAFKGCWDFCIDEIPDRIRNSEWPFDDVAIHEQEKENDDFYDYYDWSSDDNAPNIYANPYYDDRLDMDQQSIEFWNSL